MDCDSIENCFECYAGYHLYRGYCYLIPVNVAETINFQTYLESGAGIGNVDWDAAPGWDGGIPGGEDR